MLAFWRNKWFAYTVPWQIETPSTLIGILQNSSIKNFGQVIVVMLKYAA